MCHLQLMSVPNLGKRLEGLDQAHLHNCHGLNILHQHGVLQVQLQHKFAGQALLVTKQRLTSCTLVQYKGDARSSHDAEDQLITHLRQCGEP